MSNGSIEITEQDKEMYRQNGFWISPILFDEAAIAGLRNAHDRIWAGEMDGEGYGFQDFSLPEDPAKLRNLNNGWWINDEVYRAATHPAIGQICAGLMNTDEVRLFYDQVVYKPGQGDAPTGSGNNVGWHQDYAYWQCCSTDNMITAWIALQDTDISNGGMVAISGSHKWGLIPDSNTFYEQDMGKLKDKYAGSVHEWQEVPCVLKAGQVSFHHSLTFHGSGPNTTDAPRLSVIGHYIPKGAAYRARVQKQSNIRFLGPRPYDGQLFDNEYFPLLYPEATGKYMR